MFKDKFKRNIPKGILVIGILLIAVFPITAFSASSDPGPSDGIDFDSMLSAKSSVFLGAYDHAQSATYGPAGGLQTKEGTARPILWNIAEVSGDQISLLSNYVIDVMKFHTGGGSYAFNYASSTVADYLGSATFTKDFVSAEKSAGTLLAQSVSTSIYDKDNANNLDVSKPGGVNWPAVRTDTQISLPWARTMNNFPAYTDRLYYSVNGIDASYAVGSSDAQTILRSLNAVASYWTRSPHLEDYTPSPDTNKALFVDGTGKIEPALVTCAYGLRPVSVLDAKRVLLAQKISSSPSGALEIRADATLASGAVNGAGNYYTADKTGRGATSENYKLTLISDTITLSALSCTNGTAIKQDGSTGLSVFGDVPIELSAVTQGVTTGMGYKIVKETAGKREIVGCGKANTYVFNMPLVGLDGETPLAQGKYTVYVWAQMENPARSNEGSYPYSFTLNIDKTLPVTGISPLPDSRWKNEDIEVSLTAIKNASPIVALHVQIDDETELVINGASYKFTLTTDGIHKITYWAVDAAGNTEFKKEATFAIDKTPPVTEASPSGIYAPGKFVISSIDPTAHARGNQSSGLDKIYYRINNEDVEVYTVPIELSEIGEYTVQYWAVDKAGNTEIAQASHYDIKHAPTKVRLSSHKKTMLIGKKFKPGVSIAPSYAYKGLIWKSSNRKVATVSSTGRITAKAPGKATITAKSAISSAKDTIKISVEDKVKTINTSHKTIYLTKGKTVKMPIAGYTNKKSAVTLKWKTKKYGAATIIKKKNAKLAYKGSVTAKPGKTAYVKINANKTGKTNITFTSLNGKKYTVKVVVYKKPPAKAYSVKIKSPIKGNKLERKKSAILKVNISNPKAATNKIAKWKSSNPKVIKVDQTGKVTALKTGKATITVSVGSKKAKVKITSIRWKK